MKTSKAKRTEGQHAARTPVYERRCIPLPSDSGGPACVSESFLESSMLRNRISQAMEDNNAEYSAQKKPAPSRAKKLTRTVSCHVSRPSLDYLETPEIGTCTTKGPQKAAKTKTLPAPTSLPKVRIKPALLKALMKLGAKAKKSPSALVNEAIERLIKQKNG